MVLLHYWWSRHMTIRRCFRWLLLALLLASLLVITYVVAQAFTGGKETFAKRMDHATGKGVRVALLDDGILNRSVVRIADEHSFLHPLRDRGVPASQATHGISMASIIVSSTGHPHMRGVAPDAKLYSLKVLYPDGLGDLSALVEALRWCMKQEIDVVNISAGFSLNHPALKKTVREVAARGIVMVAAAGNNFGGSADYPARYDEVLAIGSLQPNGLRSHFSASQHVDLFIRGEQVRSLDGDGRLVLNQGTSVAAATVTGLTARLLEVEAVAHFKKAPQSMEHRLADIKKTLAHYIKTRL